MQLHTDYAVENTFFQPPSQKPNCKAASKLPNIQEKIVEYRQRWFDHVRPTKPH